MASVGPLLQSVVRWASMVVPAMLVLLMAGTLIIDTLPALVRAEGADSGALLGSLGYQAAWLAVGFLGLAATTLHRPVLFVVGGLMAAPLAFFPSNLVLAVPAVVVVYGLAFMTQRGTRDASVAPPA